MDARSRHPAAKALAAADIKQATELYASLLKDPALKNQHGLALAGLAKCALADKQVDVAADLLAQVC